MKIGISIIIQSTGEGGMSDLLNNNLTNVKSEIDLFGNKTEKLSMKDRIGFMPISIWEPDWTKTKQLKKIIGDSGQTRNLINDPFAKDSNSLYSQAASIFNPHLAQMILSAYCPQNSKIFDPFAGGGTRGFIATAMGHKYTGTEIRQEEVDRIIKQQKYLNKYFELHCMDCRKYDLRRNYYDFCYTCPPYYNLEVYSSLNEDMSNAPTY